MSTENDKKVLITGASGFIGQSLVRKFKAAHQEVGVYDIEKPSITPRKYIKGDIFDFEKLKEVVKEHDVIIHLVGLADSGIAQREPEKSFRLNVMSLQNVLEACRPYRNKKLLFPSSAAVYGITEDLPIKEHLHPNPTNIYSWHKYICEEIIRAYHDNFGLEYVILRLFNVYGKGSKGVINAFVENAAREETIESFGPYQYRDFVYAGDVAEAFYKSAMYEKAKNKIINIGSGKGIQIREILDLIHEIYPSAKWVYKKEQFVMYDSIADITLAKILLDFKPHSSKAFMKKTILEEIIKET
jgi:UDP-glucose 4-epimerase